MRTALGGLALLSLVGCAERALPVDAPDASVAHDADLARPADLAWVGEGVRCGDALRCASGELCCLVGGVLFRWSCAANEPLAGCGVAGYLCDGPEDCPGQRCIGYAQVSATASPSFTRCDGGPAAGELVICRVDADCPDAETCQPRDAVVPGQPDLRACR